MEATSRYIKTAILFALIWVATYFWTSCGYRRPGGLDMAPTLPSDKFQWILPKETGLENLSNSDVVFFDYQVVGVGAGSDRTAYVGRIMGMPGERVKMEKGEAFINGTKAEAGFVIGSVKTEESYEEFVVPRDTVWILMDNRKWGIRYDSRAHGPIGIGAILAKVKK